MSNAPYHRIEIDMDDQTPALERDQKKRSFVIILTVVAVVAVLFSGGLVVVLTLAAKNTKKMKKMRRTDKMDEKVSSSKSATYTGTPDVLAWTRLPNRFLRVPDVMDSGCCLFEDYPGVARIRPRIGFHSDVPARNHILDDDNSGNATVVHMEKSSALRSVLSEDGGLVFDRRARRRHRCLHRQNGVLQPYEKIKCIRLAEEVNAVAVALCKAVRFFQTPMLGQKDVASWQCFDVHVFALYGDHMQETIAAQHGYGSSVVACVLLEDVYEAHRTKVFDKIDAWYAMCDGTARQVRLPLPHIKAKSTVHENGSVCNGKTLVVVRFWDANAACPLTTPLRAARVSWFARLGRVTPKHYGLENVAVLPNFQKDVDTLYVDEECRRGDTKMVPVNSVRHDADNMIFCREGASVPRAGRVQVIDDAEQLRSLQDALDPDRYCALLDDWPTIDARDGIAWSTPYDAKSFITSRKIRQQAPSYYRDLATFTERFRKVAEHTGWKEHVLRVNHTHPYDSDLVALKDIKLDDRIRVKVRLAVERVQLILRTTGMEYHADTSRLVPIVKNTDGTVVDRRTGLMGGVESVAAPGYGWYAGHSPFLATTGLWTLRVNGMSPSDAATEVLSGGGRAVPAVPGRGCILESGVNAVHRVAPFFQAGQDRRRYNVVVWFSVRYN